jgi:hypothetical protein
VLSVLAVVLSVACAHSPEPLRIRYADLGAGALAGYTGERPLIVEFHPGDRLVVELSVDAEDFELRPEHPPMVLVVKRHCFVRFAADGIRASPDGEHFEARPREPGRFHIGLTAERAHGTRLVVAIRTPRR